MASERIGRPSREGVSPLLKIAEPLHLRNSDKPSGRAMLRGAIEESRLARVGGGMKSIKVPYIQYSLMCSLTNGEVLVRPTPTYHGALG